VLVTGAGGFIGSHLVEALLVRGAKVRAFVRYTSRKDPGLLNQLSVEDFSKIEIIAGDMRDEHAVRHAVKGCQVKIDLGVVQWDENYRISGYIEKPTYDYTVSMGIYIFEPIVMKYILFNEYLDFPDLVLKMISASEKINGYAFDGYWMDLGCPEDYAQAVEDFTSMRTQFLPEEL
jgi:dTDP-glucose pyrophosphorylase